MADKDRMDLRAVVFGVSAGGFKALHTILPEFPKDFPCPILIVQHRKGSEDHFLEQSLDSKCPLPVQEARDKEPLKRSRIYIAPGDYHLLVEKDLSLSLSYDDPICYARPSIDVLFQSASRAFEEHLIGVILTGANSDGSNGIRTIKKNKGLTIAQDPETAHAGIMPRSAVETQCIDFILPLEEIPPFIIGLLEETHG